MPASNRLAVVGALIVFGIAGNAQARIFDRIVAVVDRDPILLSELRARAAPIEKSIAEGTAAEARASAETQILHDLLELMINQRLEEREAARQHVTVSSDEIDRALGAVASVHGVTTARVLEEAVAQGLSEAAYRDELRRQLLEGKLLRVLPAVGRIQISDAEIDARLAELERSGKSGVTRDAAKDLLFGERLERIQKDWTKTLRGEVYIEVRL